jgi:hypothetical protein
MMMLIENAYASANTGRTHRVPTTETRM